mmetsp:Transcript_42709/g.76707  ORF Transcript_42709/g.76707 Transcript_42709/m.76707 type:complete len:88 (-) Transcript_42709:308-571(-)
MCTVAIQTDSLQPTDAAAPEVIKSSPKSLIVSEMHHAERPLTVHIQVLSLTISHHRQVVLTAYGSHVDIPLGVASFGPAHVLCLTYV